MLQRRRINSLEQAHSRNIRRGYQKACETENSVNVIVATGDKLYMLTNSCQHSGHVEGSDALTELRKQMM